MDKPRQRLAARLVILDLKNHLLLCQYRRGTGCYWATPGGGLEPGETHRQAALRELAEETGLSATVGEELWTYSFTFELDGRAVCQNERYFLVRLDCVEPEVHNSSPEPILRLKWWSMAELHRTDQTVYPEWLAQRLGRW